MLEKLYDIAILWGRNDISLSEKVANLVGYYRIIALHKFNSRKLTFSYKHHTIRALSFNDLRVILREVFILGDYSVALENKAPVILDCGANIGISSLYMKERYPNARITAFEPSEKTFEILKENLAHLKDVTCVRAALGKQDGGTVQFWEMSGKPGGSTGIREVHETKSSRREFVPVDVPAAKLSTHINGPIDLMKMDIEGGEGIVLDELLESGKLQQIRELVFEYHYNPSNEQNRLSRILSLLEDNGFSLVIFGSDVRSSSEILKSKDAYHFMIRAFQKTSSRI